MSLGLGISVKGVAGDGTPLGTLAGIVKQKAKLLRKSWQDVAIGAMITAIRSLRTMTREAKPARRTRPKVSLAARGLYVSWSGKRGGKNKQGKDMQRCLRNRSGHRDTSLERKYRVMYYCSPASRTARPYLVVPEREKSKPYIAVAESAAAARELEQKRAAKRKRHMGGFAKTALGYAMARLSTRNAGGMKKFDNRTSWTQLVAAGVKGSSEIGGTEVFVHDLLDYAALAVRGGKPAIDLAVKKAANKLTGEMMHYVNARGADFFTARNMPVPKLSIPYPEIKRSV